MSRVILRPEELEPLVEIGIVEYFGEQSDVRLYIEQTSVYVLPSYHEGTLENLAMRRAIITTDAPSSSRKATSNWRLALRNLLI